MKTSTIHKKLSLFWPGVLLFLFLIAIIFITDEIKYFGLKQDILGRYWDIKWWLISHLSGGILALILGPLQFWTKFRNKFLKLHRTLGKIYLIAILIASLSSTYMAWNTAVAIHFTWALSLQVLAFMWIATAFMAYRTIRLKRIQQHKEWMIRSYIVTFGFVAFRFIDDILRDADIGTFIERAPSIIYTMLLIPLFAAELIFQWDKNK